MLHVHYENASENQLAKLIRPLLDDTIRFTIGTSEPTRLDCHVYVGGNLDHPETFDQRPNLTHVVLPWVGVSTHTQALVAARPHLSLHNLHHNALATAETAIALLFAAAQKTLKNDQLMRQGIWRNLDAVANDTLTLAGRNALILGYGAIGKQIAHVCQALQMNVSTIRRSTVTPTQSSAGVMQYPASALQRLLPTTNVLICALPATAETKHIVDATALALLPANAVFVNVGRGSNVEQEALYNALSTGALGAAGLDVWFNYPQDINRALVDAHNSYPADYPFWDLENVVLSPHRGGMGDLTEEHRAPALAEVLNAIARGQPVPNKIDFDRQY